MISKDISGGSQECERSLASYWIANVDPNGDRRILDAGCGTVGQILNGSRAMPEMGKIIGIDLVSSTALGILPASGQWMASRGIKHPRRTYLSGTNLRSGHEL